MIYICSVNQLKRYKQPSQLNHCGQSVATLADRYFTQFPTGSEFPSQIEYQQSRLKSVFPEKALPIKIPGDFPVGLIYYSHKKWPTETLTISRLVSTIHYKWTRDHRYTFARNFDDIQYVKPAFIKGALRIYFPTFSREPRPLLSRYLTKLTLHTHRNKRHGGLFSTSFLLKHSYFVFKIINHLFNTK